MAKIYHNPRCSKSRQALALLQDRGIDPEVVLYLKDPPDEAELRQIISRLKLTAAELLRAKETIAKTVPLNNEAEIIAAMATHPILIERPIVLTDKGAVIARPPERLLDIL